MQLTIKYQPALLLGGLALVLSVSLGTPRAWAGDNAKLADQKAKAAIGADDENEDDDTDGDDPLALEQDGDAADPDAALDDGVGAEAAADSYLQGSAAHVGADGTAAHPGPAESSNDREKSPPVHAAKAEILLPPPASTAAHDARSAPLPQALTITPQASTKTHKPDVASVQKALNGTGARLAIDGVMGQRTKVALTDFQKRHGLKATGEATAETLGLLGINR